MPGFGFGPGGRVRSRSFATLGAPTSAMALVPSGQWDGSAGSGFSSVPVDPARLTAKPAMQLLVPPNQYFTEEIVVGVYAGANDQGTLINAMGLAKLVVHYEGTTEELLEPSVHICEDVNGTIRKYPGWWTVLRNDGRHGHAQVFFEAVPRDPNMQRRVIGPFQFSPQVELHDGFLEIAASVPEVEGVRYQTLSAALTFARAQGWNNPLLTFSESGEYDPDGSTGGGSYVGEGWANITCAQGVSITLAKQVYTSDADAGVRTRYDGLRFVGQGITLDKRNISEIRNEANRGNWLDGINVTDSAAAPDGTSYSVWRHGPAILPWILRDGGYITECTIERINDPLRGLLLARGNSVSHCYGDVFSGTPCTYFNTLENMNSEFWWEERLAISGLQYMGSATSATIELSGGNGSSRTLTLTEDGVVPPGGVFSIQIKEADFLANTNYTVANVVDWLNGLNTGDDGNLLVDWQASLGDNLIKASFLSIPGNTGRDFGPLDAKSAPLDLITTLDIHADGFASDGLSENIVIAGNRGFKMYTQDIFFGYPGGTFDALVVNNAFHNSTSTNPDHGVQENQLNRQQSHVVFAHNCFATRRILLRTNSYYDPDQYCLLVNNVFEDISWSDGEDPDLVVDGNHVWGSGANIQYATNHSAAGDGGTLFANAELGDFTPTALLLGFPKQPAVRLDRLGRLRTGSAPAGPLLE